MRFRRKVGGGLYNRFALSCLYSCPGLVITELLPGDKRFVEVLNTRMCAALMVQPRTDLSRFSYELAVPPRSSSDLLWEALKANMMTEVIFHYGLCNCDAAFENLYPFPTFTVLPCCGARRRVEGGLGGTSLRTTTIAADTFAIYHFLRPA